MAAACGLKVAKHGNRSVSSRSGSSDLLAAFGINTDMNAERSREALDDLGVCFLFAPKYHTGFRHAMPVRQQLKTRTLFNVLGPLINPAHPPLALIGVYSPELVLPIAETLRVLGYQRAAVVHSGEWMKCPSRANPRRGTAQWRNPELPAGSRRLWFNAVSSGGAGRRHAGRKP